MATISDVARRAGVSAATVSRVINGVPVTPRLARAVRTAVADLAFVPNGTARTLRRRRSPLIAFICPDLGDPRVLRMISGAQRTALRAGCTLVICCSEQEPDREADLLQLAASESMTGVLLLPVDRSALLSADLRAVLPFDRSADRSAPPLPERSRVILVEHDAAGGDRTAEAAGAAAVRELLRADQSTGSTEKR